MDPKNTNTKWWNAALLQIIRDPERHGNAIYYKDEHVIIAFDKFPKAKKHLLILPREEIDGPQLLTQHHVPLLVTMHERGLWLEKKLTEEYPSLTFKMGYHALPSMQYAKSLSLTEKCFVYVTHTILSTKTTSLARHQSRL